MIILYSVQLEANSWNDDSFNGTFEECVNYCKENDYNPKSGEARIAKFEYSDKNEDDYVMDNDQTWNNSDLANKVIGEGYCVNLITDF